MKIVLLSIFFLISCNEDIKLKKQTKDLKVTKKPHVRSDDIDPNPEPAPGSRPLCTSVCPSDYTVLKGNDSAFNFLAFRNFTSNGIGRCRGMALVNQKLGELAYFKGGQSSCNTLPSMSTSCLNEMREKIRFLMNNKASSIDGFSDLYEFSNHPQIKSILKSYVAGTSHIYTANYSNPRQMEENLSFFENIFKEITYRIYEKQQPYIGIKGFRGLEDHAVLAYDVSYVEGQKVLCIRDSNHIFVDFGENCQNYIFHKNGYIYYSRVGYQVEQLSKFFLFTDEDERVKKYIKAQQNFCRVKTRCV